MPSSLKIWQVFSSLAPATDGVGQRDRPAGSASGVGQRDVSGLIGQSLWALLAGGGGATWASRPDCDGRNSGLQALDLPAPNTRASIANFAHRQQPVAEEVCSSGSRCMM